MVPGRGFEPRFTASKAAVLPLDDPGILLATFGVCPKNSFLANKQPPRSPIHLDSQIFLHGNRRRNETDKGEAEELAAKDH